MSRGVTEETEATELSEAREEIATLRAVLWKVAKRNGGSVTYLECACPEKPDFHLLREGQTRTLKAL